MFSLTACAKEPVDQIPVFWKWFQSNELQLFTGLSASPTDNSISAFSAQLKAIDDDLAFEVGKASGGMAELDVSADGIEELFPVVERIVASAPKMKYWKVVAFRQPTPPETLKTSAIRYRSSEGTDGNLAVSDMRASAKRNGDKAAVIIYIKDYDGSEDHQRMSLIMLQQAIGEYDLIKRVESVQYKPTSEATDENSVPLAEFGKAFDKALPKTSKN